MHEWQINKQVDKYPHLDFIKLSNSYFSHGQQSLSSCYLQVFLPTSPSLHDTPTPSLSYVQLPKGYGVTTTSRAPLCGEGSVTQNSILNCSSSSVTPFSLPHENGSFLPFKDLGCATDIHNKKFQEQSLSNPKHPCKDWGSQKKCRKTLEQFKGKRSFGSAHKITSKVEKGLFTFL